MLWKNVNTCIQWWYTWWLAHMSKGGEVWEEKELVLSDRMLASVGLDFVGRIQSVGAERRSLGLMTGRWWGWRTRQAGNTISTSGHADVVQRCLAEGDRTLSASGHSWSDVSGHEKPSLDPYWKCSDSAWGCVRSFNRASGRWLEGVGACTIWHDLGTSGRHLMHVREGCWPLGSRDGGWRRGHAVQI
jgi:hypothetical protein